MTRRALVVRALVRVVFWALVLGLVTEAALQVLLLVPPVLARRDGVWFLAVGGALWLVARSMPPWRSL